MMRYTILTLTICTATLFADSDVSRLDRLEALVLTQQKRIEKLEAVISRQETLIDMLKGRANSAAGQPKPEVEPLPAERAVSPLRFQLGGAWLTPFGFVDYAVYLRDKAAGSGVGTNFGGIPFNDSGKRKSAGAAHDGPGDQARPARGF